MKHILRTALVFFSLISIAFAESLEIKLNGKSIQLPYWSASKNPHGAVVLIKGGSQATWSLLLAHLAKQLSANGWSAVLVNCNAGNSEPWIKELPEVLNTLSQQKNARIVVVHYGEQLQQTLDLFSSSQKVAVQGLILLSAYNVGNNDDKKANDKKTADKKPGLNLPLLDIVGQFDFDFIIQQMQAREKTITQNKYLALTIPGAHHDYEYSRPFLLSFIQGWMLHLAVLKPPPVLVSYIASMEPLMPKQLAFDEESDLSGYYAEPSEEPTQEIMEP